MRELQVHAAAVDVEGLAEILHRHRRALDMPAGAAASERRVPARLIVRPDKLPQGEIARVFLLVFVSVDTFAAAGDVAFETDLRQLAVFRERRDAVVDRTVRLIR